MIHLTDRRTAEIFPEIAVGIARKSRYILPMDIVLNASAGTGKTFQVTGLYERLVLDEGIDPREILLMTFTDNAAAELRMRVAQRIMKARRGAEAESDHELTERAVNAMARLPSAPIGTFHSYCTRLLREHALEAGLSPSFSVLVGDEYEELLSQIAREELLKQLGTDPALRTFCSGASIIGSGRGFGSSVTETVPAVIGQAGSLGISLENAEAMLPPPRPTASRTDFEMICEQIRNLPRITPAVQTALGIIEQSLQETDDVEALVDRMESLGIKKFGRGAKDISDAFWELKESVKEAVRYRERYPAARAFARYLQSVATAFAQRKHDMDVVDFDDLLRLGTALLQSGKAKPGFRYVIVDEVQDTSRIQCDLIQALWGEETDLVICGDKKQSIYTWRGADPQVMPDLQRMILDAKGDPRNLKISYRSKGPILDVVNRIFSSVYAPEDYAEDDRLELNPDFKTDGEKPCIEFLESDCDDELSMPEKVAAEMAAVANRIQLLIHGPRDWQPNYRYADGFQPLENSNRYRYSDILILLRRTTHQSALEQALRTAGVPYTLGGKGRGLFTRQETRDVSLALNVITNPKDTLSLIGFLRSPWVGLSDESIAQLAWTAEGFSPERLTSNYAEATDIIDRYRELSGTRLASELVRMLIDETGYDALLAGLPRGTQRLANLRKVLDWLREAERGARTTPAQVARKLTELIASPPQVPEAALLDPAQNAVTLMTVHGAKGLTRRVVFLPDISSRPQNDTGFCNVFFADAPDGEKKPMLGLKITAPDKSVVTSPGFKEAAARFRRIREHEQKNLFYVALTRARDLVVTSATRGCRASGWMTDLEPFIRKEIPAFTYSALAAAAELPDHPGMQIPDKDELASALERLSPPPLPPALQRIPATRLAKALDEAERDELFETPRFQSPENAAALGSLGHAVLEQLALNDWTGDVFQWLENLRGEFGVDAKAANDLADRIEQTRRLMMKESTAIQELHPEFPFVLRDGERLIDGTIDLLCSTDDGFRIYDYKFTEAEDAGVADLYRGQMAVYRKAAERIYPDARSKTVQLVVISTREPRLIPLAF